MISSCGTLANLETDMSLDAACILMPVATSPIHQTVTGRCWPSIATARWEHDIALKIPEGQSNCKNGNTLPIP